jgi:hypothetical protein
MKICRLSSIRLLPKGHLEDGAVVHDTCGRRLEATHARILEFAVGHCCCIFLELCVVSSQSSKHYMNFKQFSWDNE